MANLSQFADDLASWSNAKRISVARRRLQQYNDKLLEWCRTWKIELSTSKTQVIGFGCNLDKKEIYQIINGHKVSHKEPVKFLGVYFDSHMKWTSHTKHQLRQLKQRIGLFSTITGSVNHPRADNDTCLQILKHMIEPLIYYAPSALCTRSDTQFIALDQQITRAARLALHIPKTISGIYVKDRANLTNSKERSATLAKNYITNPVRSQSVKNSYVKGKTNAKRKRHILTPKTIIQS